MKEIFLIAETYLKAEIPLKVAKTDVTFAKKAMIKHIVAYAQEIIDNPEKCIKFIEKEVDPEIEFPEGLAWKISIR